MVSAKPMKRALVSCDSGVLRFFNGTCETQFYLPSSKNHQNYTGLLFLFTITGTWSVGGGCEYKCQESEAALDLVVLTVQWARTQTTLSGVITCKDGYRLTGTANVACDIQGNLYKLLKNSDHTEWCYHL